MLGGGDSVFPYPLKSLPPPIISQDEALALYFKKFSPVLVEIEGRIIVTNETKQDREWDLVEAQAGGQWPQQGEQLGFRLGGEGGRGVGRWD